MVWDQNYVVLLPHIIGFFRENVMTQKILHPRIIRHFSSNLYLNLKLFF